MDRAVITERFLELVAGREVLAAVFTTYTFEPNFFELEVIPLLLRQDMPYSTDDRVKRFMVRENLREANIPIDVFYDLPVFRASGDQSPEMEYLCNGVDLRNRAFHGKVNMILIKNTKTGEESLLLGAGSNNLTLAGWWDNVECQHWKEVRSGAVPRMFVNQIKEEIDFLKNYASTAAGSKQTAIHRMEEFISTCGGSNSAAPIHYYGISHRQNRGSFPHFIRNKISPLIHDKNWSLEIISPFFANDAGNKEHKIFNDMGINEINLLLPRDSDGNALCESSYYENIQAEQKVHWAEWRDKLKGPLGLNGELFRRLHAKIFHFHNKQQSWVFVGSVNFTHKALHENCEAGFLVKLEKAETLLERIPENFQIDKFTEPSESVPGKGDDLESEVACPDLHLCYDWVSNRLTGRTSRSNICQIEILGAEDEPVIDPWDLCDTESEYEGEVHDLKRVLRNGSLIKVRGRDLTDIDKSEFPPQRVLLQQIGWSHKPLDLPQLTAAQILAIYSGMSPERRQMLLVDAEIRELVLSAQGGELTSQADEQIIDQFFCEYAEIFSAFSTLKKRLERMWEDKQFNNVDYYLTGAGVDSLPSLIERAQEKDGGENRASEVTCYLLLLSALEIYRIKTFKQRPNVKEREKELRHKIRMIRKSDRLKLENNDSQNRQQFFKWFEEEFFRVYKVVEEESCTR